jgi:hypothetical protein
MPAELYYMLLLLLLLLPVCLQQLRLHSPIAFSSEAMHAVRLLFLLLEQLLQTMLLVKSPGPGWRLINKTNAQSIACYRLNTTQGPASAAHLCCKVPHSCLIECCQALLQSRHLITQLSCFLVQHTHTHLAAAACRSSSSSSRQEAKAKAAGKKR